MARGAPHGPRLTRKDTAAKRARESLASVAYQIGILIAIQRNRWNMNQTDLAKKVGIEQIDVSNIENGQPTGKRVTDQKVDALFAQLDLKSAKLQANFLKWWRDNG